MRQLKANCDGQVLRRLFRAHTESEHKIMQLLHPQVFALAYGSVGGRFQHNIRFSLTPPLFPLRTHEPRPPTLRCLAHHRSSWYRLLRSLRMGSRDSTACQSRSMMCMKSVALFDSLVGQGKSKSRDCCQQRIQTRRLRIPITCVRWISFLFEPKKGHIGLTC